MRTRMCIITVFSEYEMLTNEYVTSAEIEKKMTTLQLEFQ